MQMFPRKNFVRIFGHRNTIFLLSTSVAHLLKESIEKNIETSMKIKKNRNFGFLEKNRKSKILNFHWLFSDFLSRFFAWCLVLGLQVYWASKRGKETGEQIGFMTVFICVFDQPRLLCIAYISPFLTTLFSMIFMYFRHFLKMSFQFHICCHWHNLSNITNWQHIGVGPSGRNFCRNFCLPPVPELEFHLWRQFFSDVDKINNFWQQKQQVLFLSNMTPKVLLT